MLSVRIDVDQLLLDRAIEAANPPKPVSSKPKRTLIKVKKEITTLTLPNPSPNKRKSQGGNEPVAKKIKIKASSASSSKIASKAPGAPLPKLSVTLKLPPRPADPEAYPCCLCISMDKEGLLRVHDPPMGRKEAIEAAGNPKVWMAHEACANIVPETWVDEIDTSCRREKVIFGVDGIVKDRWNLVCHVLNILVLLLMIDLQQKCSACTKTRPKAHGAPIQCTKGKCPRAFHVSCAREGSHNNIVFNIIREVEKEVLLLALETGAHPSHPEQMQVDSSGNQSHPNPGSADGPVATGSEGGSRVLKIIKKVEVQVLCTQHNPVRMSSSASSPMVLNVSF